MAYNEAKMYETAALMEQDVNRKVTIANPTRNRTMDANIAIWPTRTSRPVKHVKTNAPERDKSNYQISDDPPPTYNVKAKTVSIPIGDNAYDRTVRLNAALHVLHSTQNYQTHLDVAIDEAKVHLKAKLTGVPRRDEVTTALTDLRKTKAVKLESGQDLAMLTTVRSLAILRDGGVNKKHIHRAITKYVSPYLPKGANLATQKALDVLEKNPTKAKKILKSYFKELKLPPDCSFPQAGETHPDKDGLPMGGIQALQAILDSVITEESGDLLSPATIAGLLKEEWLPQMEVVKLATTHSIRTCFGYQERSALSGIKIRAKKLALTVGPNMPRIFTKKIDRESGGAVLIDASGSMGFTVENLKNICEMLPMATIAYYESRSDDDQPGGRPDYLHVYSEKGLRTTIEDLPRIGGGNMIDFPALQWLIKQPGPRWFLTDGGFTGPEGAVRAAHELSQNAHKKKIIKMVRTIDTIIGDIEKRKGFADEKT